MNKKWVVIGAVAIIVIAVAIAISLNRAFAGAGSSSSGAAVVGEAQGFGGPVTARVTLSEGRITALEITGDGETPGIGSTAIEVLTETILEAGGIEGVDAVSGATITSNAVFDAVRQAISSAQTASAPDSSITHGLGICSVGRSLPRSDDLGAKLYSFNVVIAYALFDNAGRILDLEVDHVEVSTPNYGSPTMPALTGFPGQSYSGGSSIVGQTYETYLSQVESWRTKRERGDTYRMPSGTWEEQMNIFEQAFKGMTIAELQDWYATYCSDINGKPLSPDSSNEADIAKYNALANKAALDAVSGATMSLNDSHGDLVGAIVKAYENRRPVEASHIAHIGLANTNSGTVGYGTDNQGASNYSFNIQATGAAYDEGGRMLAVYTDVLQVSTPNAHGPALTGFPGQSYSGGDSNIEQTEEAFFQQVAAWQTKREQGSSYMMPSGSWADQMDIFDEFFAGMTAEEMNAWFATHCSDIDGKVLAASSSNEADVAKYNALSDEQKDSLDALSGASMSLRNNYGDLLGTIEKAWNISKTTNITVSQ